MLPSNDEFDQPHPIVYLQDEQVFGTIISYGAFVSKVVYEKDGTIYEVYVENDDLLDGD